MTFHYPISVTTNRFRQMLDELIVLRLIIYSTKKNILSKKFQRLIADFCWLLPTVNYQKLFVQLEMSWQSTS
jgi:hypothetical protein